MKGLEELGRETEDFPNRGSQLQIPVKRPVFKSWTDLPGSHMSRDWGLCIGKSKGEKNGDCEVWDSFLSCWWADELIYLVSVPTYQCPGQCGKALLEDHLNGGKEKESKKSRVGARPEGPWKGRLWTLRGRGGQELYISFAVKLNLTWTLPLYNNPFSPCILVRLLSVHSCTEFQQWP